MTKKKTNRQKRTLVGAVCVAAVIMAGSTFAWFTSSDEVTNRLTASADYGVSIVESFTPPKNWIPGQKIEKDVYATNTGNIGAYVEQDVSGVLTITTEKPETTFSADCVELTQEERYVMEAGAYLAFTDNTTDKPKIGEQAVVRPADNTTSPIKTDFTPSGNGVYVFRRSIGVDKTTQVETFEYAGYYVNDGKYYKIGNLQVTPDTTGDFAGDAVRTDGNLSAVSYKYYKDVTETVKNVDLAYLEVTGAAADAFPANGNYLVATYDTGVNAKANDLEALGKAYDEAMHNYQLALELQTAAGADNTAATTAVTTAKSTLDEKATALSTALADLRAAENTVATKKAAYDALSTEKSGLETEKEQLELKMYGKTNGSVTDCTDNSLYKASIKEIGTAPSDDGKAAFDTEFSAWVTAYNSTHFTSYGTTDNLPPYEIIRDNFTVSTEGHTYYKEAAVRKAAQEQYSALNTRYTEVNSRIDEIGADTDNAKPLGAAKKAYNDAVADLGASTDATTVTTKWGLYNKAQKEYDEAFAAYQQALTDAGTPGDNKDNADAQVKAAKAAYDAAKAAYDAANTGTIGGSSELKIYIKLSEDAVTTGGTAGKWQLLPSNPLTAGTSPITGNIAKFYYTSILPGGQTSSKLIESVTLDKNATQDMYKSFDFDLNVALKSAQITYDTDNTTILTTPANESLSANATLATPTSEASVITWTAKS